MAESVGTNASYIRKILSLLKKQRLLTVTEESAVSVPGNRPYKKAGGAGLVPKPSKACVKCGVCAKNCPVQAIDSVTLSADTKKCISCMRCVKQCPHNARKVNGAMVSVAAIAIKFGQKRK